jgi:hypothetical protein
MENITEDIELIRRHTNYTDEDVILAKLQEFYTAVAVITDYISSSSPSSSTRSKHRSTPATLSVNQEIYRQMRDRLKITKNNNLCI